MPKKSRLVATFELEGPPDRLDLIHQVVETIARRDVERTTLIAGIIAEAIRTNSPLHDKAIITAATPSQNRVSVIVNLEDVNPEDIREGWVETLDRSAGALLSRNSTTDAGDDWVQEEITKNAAARL